MKKLILLSLTFLAMACNKHTEAKKETQILKDTVTKIGKIIKKGKKTIEKFDREKFENNADREGYYYIKLADSTKITQDAHGEKSERSYSEKIQQKNNPIIITKFYSHNGTLITKGERFHDDGFFKGIWLEYDEQGILVKETNHDIPYKDFPWEKVKQYAENRGINLMLETTKVNRAYGGWGIVYRLNETEKYHGKVYDSDTDVNIGLDRKGRLTMEFLTFWEESSFTDLAKDDIGNGYKGLIIIDNTEKLKTENKTKEEIQDERADAELKIFISISTVIVFLAVCFFCYMKFIRKD